MATLHAGQPFTGVLKYEEVEPQSTTRPLAAEAGKFSAPGTGLTTAKNARLDYLPATTAIAERGGSATCPVRAVSLSRSRPVIPASSTALSPWFR